MLDCKFPNINGKIYTDEGNIIDILYKPSLKCANEYVRGVGYFRSNVWNLMDKELLDFILRDKNNKMVLITSIVVQSEDYDAILEGKKQSSEAAIQTLNQMMHDKHLKDAVKMLTAIIASKQMEVYVVIREGTGMYHNKTGYFKSNDDILVFEGSGNETKPALTSKSSEANSEIFTIYTKSSTDSKSWKNDQYKTIMRLNREMTIGPIEGTIGSMSTKIEQIERGAFPEMGKEDWELESHRKKAGERSKEKMKKVIERLKKYKKAEQIDQKINRSLQEMINDRGHQINSLKKWRKADYKGILEHATGSGKTITALAAIKNHLDLNNPVIIVVPDSPLLPQWEEEIKKYIGVDIEISKFGNNEQTEEDYSLMDDLELDGIYEPKIILFLLKTFAQNKTIINNIVNAMLNNNLRNILFVSDECHSIGIDTMKVYSDVRFGKSLGLSATPIRDDEGDQLISKLLGEVIDVFTLKDAIIKGYLTPYKYKLKKVYLNNIEMRKYEKLRKLIGIQMANKASGISDDMSATYAARNVIKMAIGKENAAIEILKHNYKKGQYWIVYVSPGEMMERIRERIKNEVKTNPFQYSSKNKKERDYEMREFENSGGIMLGIKCLDQGVNIPKLTHGLILSSSTKDREFIQRRGRLLRGAPGKDTAYIWDLVTLPQMGYSDGINWSIIKNEINRIEEFSETSSNPNSSKGFIQKIKIEYRVGI